MNIKRKRSAFSKILFFDPCHINRREPPYLHQMIGPLACNKKPYWYPKDVVKILACGVLFVSGGWLVRTLFLHYISP